MQIEYNYEILKILDEIQEKYNNEEEYIELENYYIYLEINYNKENDELQNISFINFIKDDENYIDDNEHILIPLHNYTYTEIICEIELEISEKFYNI